MTGLIVTWDEQEIQAIDDGDFESAVVEVIDSFFEAVHSYREVTVEWTTPTRNHNSVYKVSEPPLTHLDRSRCFLDIQGKQKGGEYQLDLNPEEFRIKTKSSGRTEKLTFLRLRPEGLEIDPEEQEVFLENLPERITNRVVETIENIQ